MYIDFHSHILPCADHGSDGTETSLRQIENAFNAGVDTIVATPHFYPRFDTVEEFLERREASYQQLARHDLRGIRIVKAAEVHITADIERIEGLEKLCIENTNYILLEFPPEPWPFWIEEAVYRVAASKRLRPICAHVDRYSKSGREKILATDAGIQINARSLVGNPAIRHRYKNLIEDGFIHLLGSDSHGDGKVAYKEFAIAVKKLGSLADEMTKNARKILEGDFIY